MYQKEGNCISRVSTESFIPWRVVYDNQYCHSFLMIFSVLCLTLNTSTCLIFNLALLKQFSSTFTEETVLFAVTVDAIQYPRANELSDSLWSIGLTQWSIYSLLRMMAPSFYDREECIAFWSFCLLELLWILLTFLHKKNLRVLLSLHNSSQISTTSLLMNFRFFYFWFSESVHLLILVLK